jgi:Tfp pilus assembly protein PilO
MANGNGYVRPILIGVAILVIGAAVIGSATTTVNQRELVVTVATLKEDVDEQKVNVAKIPVMNERIKDIKEDVGKILRKMEDGN